MKQFNVDQNAVKKLAKDLRAALGPGVRHKAMIGNICAALGWRDDVLMHHLKQFAEAGRSPFPAIAVPATFSRDLAQVLSKSYGRDISRADVERHFWGRDMMAAGILRPVEVIFGAVARTMVRNGWSVFPQEVSGRRPGSIDGKIIKWNEGYDLVNTPPVTAVLDHWIERCPELNVGVVMGPASGNAFIIDIDVDDPGLSAAVQKLAIKHLRQTPLRRMGRWPKMALVYRQNIDDRISSRRHGISVADQSASPDAAEQCIEVLAEGLAMTMHGKDIQTGAWFQWLQDSPVDVGPDACPIVTSRQLAEFFAAVNEIRPRSSETKQDLQIITDDNVRLTGTVFSSRKIIKDADTVIETLSSGGLLRGWYAGVESAGAFELLTAEDMKGCEEFHPDYGAGRRVSGKVVKSLVEQGLIRIPRSQGRHNRLAVARLEAEVAATA
jgi:hypothetical protein